MDIEAIGKELEAIKERNRRVEAEKAWETSWFRILSVAALIWSIAALVLSQMRDAYALRDALIPAVGFVLSTLSLPFLKRHWIRRHLGDR